MNTCVPFLSLLALGAALAAQEPGASRAPLTPASLGDGLFRAPIHTQPDDPTSGAYGRWASGDGYKASFHDGFVFYPVLGESYPENLPLRWRTLDVRAGGRSIATTAASEHVHTDWRYEYRFGGVTEAYDVLPVGVEQTFVIASRPATRGELVVEGRIETALHTADAPASQQALVFCDDAGVPVVSYGEAKAFDSLGRETPVTTSYEGGLVRLTVPAPWLETATFPVTVDPLTTSVLVNNQVSQLARDLSIHREDESPVLNTMVAYMRAVSASDFDAFARLGSADFAQSTLVMADVAPAYSTLMPDVAFVGGADRWTIALWRHFAADDRVRVYFHDRENLVLNSGVFDISHNPPGEFATFPSIAGSSHPTLGTSGYLVYRMDPFFGNSSVSKVHGIEVDAFSRTLAPTAHLVAGSVGDAENPEVNCQRGWGEAGWLVVYTERTSANDDYDVFAVGVEWPTFLRGNRAQVGPDNLGDKVRPVVNGWDGRFLVAMLQDVTPETNGHFYGRNVLTARVDWAGGTATPQARPHRGIVNNPNQALTQLDLGYDGVTRSHWCLTFDRNVFTSLGSTVLRLGQTGAIVEQGDLGADMYHAAVAWNGAAREFQIVAAHNGPNGVVNGWRLQQPASAWHLLYGNGCGPGQIDSDTFPYPGSEFYRVQLLNAPQQVVGALCFSTNVGGVELSAIGAPNCWSNLASLDVMLPIVTDGSGNAHVWVPLPDAPLFLGDLYWQYVYIWPAAPTPFPIGTTRGMRASVRNN